MRKMCLALLATLVAGASASAASFGDTLRQARLELDLSRPAASVELYEQALAMRPASAERLADERAWAYVKLGYQLLSAGDYSKADACYSLAAAIYPDFKSVFSGPWAFVKIQRINAEISDAVDNNRDADWEALTRELEWVTTVAPDNRQAYFLLGIISEINGRNQQARDYYRRSLKDRASAGDAPASQLRERAHRQLSGLKSSFAMRPIFPPWRRSEAGDFQTLTAGPFVIHHHNRALAERVAAVLEYHLARPLLDGVLKPFEPFPKACDVYIYADEAAFKAVGGSEVWAGGRSKFAVRGDDLVSAAIQLYQTAPDLTESAAPHELTHVRFVAAAPFSDGMPLWLQEGMAGSAESAYRLASHARRLDRARREGSLIPFVKLAAFETYPSKENNELFYAESAAAVQALVARFGADRFWKFIYALEDEDVTQALASVYSITPVQVESLILEWSAARK